MCGRFALFADIKQIEEHFQLRRGFIMRPRYNIAPTQMIPIITTLGRGVVFSRWSFLPHWAKAQDGQMPQGYINARQETLLEKPTFKQAALKKRCIVPISGYYEWKALGGKKQPFYIFSPGRAVLGLAGIWSVWHEKQSEEENTCAVITIASGDKLSAIHERKPVILQPKDYEAWLDPKSNETQISDCFEAALDEQLLKAYPVSPQMNAPSFDLKECVSPL
tara:strand:- start:134400 stop:135062 length:663 start_codon:yes stop_codon:yes gene_type:complete